MKIEVIKISIENSQKIKLIAYSKVIDFPGCKTQVSPCILADFNCDINVLRIFSANYHEKYIMDSWSDALRFILRMDKVKFKVQNNRVVYYNLKTKNYE